MKKNKRVMRLIIFIYFLLALKPNAYSQKLSLDDLFRINSKGITEIRKILKAKGFSLEDMNIGAYGAPTYKWFSKDGAKQVFF